MRAVFCHDHRFVLDGEGGVFSSGVFPHRVWQRYLEAFDSVTVVARRWPSGREGELKALSRSDGRGISFVFVPSADSPSGLAFHRFKAAAILREAISHADVVISRMPSEIGLLGARLARSLGKPWAIEVAGCPWDGLVHHGSWQGKLYAPVAMWRLRRAVAGASHVIYVTDGFLQRRYPARGRVAAVSNVDIPGPEPSTLQKRLARIGDGAGRLLTFGLIGSLGNRCKGVHTAIRALAEVRERLPEFQFRVLGQGDPSPYQVLAERLGVAANVRFCGTLPAGGPVLEWLDDVDIYLQPSFHEGLPRALIEAMSRGCPAIGSTAGGIPELLDAECLHRPGDHGRFASLVERAVQDREWRARQAQRNCETAKAYSREVLEQRRGAFWREFATYARRAQGSAEKRGMLTVNLRRATPGSAPGRSSDRGGTTR